MRSAADERQYTKRVDRRQQRAAVTLFGAGLLTPPSVGPQVSSPLGDLRSDVWRGRETGHH
ncbi:MAG: hypothetical protein JNG89_08400 [Planctomycetaceae bacterium]|nr:hypothetical protein [Planctomycetaceae bacterium]